MSTQAGMQVRPEWLRACSALAGLDDDELAGIAALAEVEDFGRNELVFDQGSEADKLYVIVSGRVAVIRSGHVAAELTAGEFFGEMAMFNGSRRVAAVRALADTRLAVVAESRVQPLLRAAQPATVKLIQHLGSLMLVRMREADGQLRAGPGALPALVLEEYRQLSRELLASWALAYHSIGKPGKLAVAAAKPSATAADLSVAYSPGVAEPCTAIAADPEAAYAYTAKGHLVGVITNGTAVLGLGPIGALAAKPVMEGKAVLLKRFADVDAFDIEIDETDPSALVETVLRISPTFGAILLEDIAAPHCFWIEEQCLRRLGIPVLHDDQHGTAIIVGAALRNALRLAGKSIGAIRVVFAGAGAAGFATARYLTGLGVRHENVVLSDEHGVIHSRRELPLYLREFAIDNGTFSLEQAVCGADVFVGLSAANVLSHDMLRSMAHDPIVFALANPEPEIDPRVALDCRPDVIIATGRSDYPNQVNNVLAFPYLFRGALDIRARAITPAMMRAATQAIAALARETDSPDGRAFGPGYLIPQPFDQRLLPEVATAVAAAGMRDGTARAALDLADYRAELTAFANGRP
jgi:malate dehydrogenase (oxaloacetate-decarboxylating)(NADP+)